MILFCGGSLSIDGRQGTVDISTTKKGLRVEGWSMDWDTKDYIFFVEESKEYNKSTKWDFVNATELYDKCIEQLICNEYYGINVYRTVKK